MGKTDTILFGAGCFWCVEAVFQQLVGVVKVESGYAGGSLKNPGYREVSTGRTGHAEVVRIIYQPEQIAFSELLDVFWTVHDPTSLNRQGADTGTQYRSVIFYYQESQKVLAEKAKKELNASGIYAGPVVTEIRPFTAFYPAEEEHRNYYLNQPNAPYCRMVISPKLEKFRNTFPEKWKD